MTRYAFGKRSGYIDKTIPLWIENGTSVRLSARFEVYIWENLAVASRGCTGKTARGKTEAERV
jgi:hypothetical protein